MLGCRKPRTRAAVSAVNSSRPPFDRIENAQECVVHVGTHHVAFPERTHGFSEHFLNTSANARWNRSRRMTIELPKPADESKKSTREMVTPTAELWTPRQLSAGSKISRKQFPSASPHTPHACIQNFLGAPGCNVQRSIQARNECTPQASSASWPETGKPAIRAGCFPCEAISFAISEFRPT